MIVSQYAELLRHSPWTTGTSIQQLGNHTYWLSSILWNDPDVVEFASLVSRASQIRAVGVSAWGHDLLPVAARFGVVKSSGVVGVDEKYVLVPKNDKPPGVMRRWMYVYLAVDVWTCDLW